MSEQINIKPVLDTSVLQKQLDLSAPNLKINIDTSYLSGQIQSAMGNLNLQAIRVPVQLAVDEKQVQSAITPQLNTRNMYGMNTGRQQIPPAGNLQSGSNNADFAAGSSSGSFKSILSAGTNIINTYNGLSNILQSVSGIAGSISGTNFSKSFD